MNAGIHPECVESVEKTAKLLEGLGHAVEEAEPAIDGIALAGSYFTLYYGEIEADIVQLGRTLGRNPSPADVEATTWLLNLLGKAFTSGEFVQAIRQWNTFARQMGSFHEKYDMYLTPTTARPPARIGELKPGPAEEFIMKIVNGLGLGRMVRWTGLAEKIAIESLARTPFTQLANLTGQPACRCRSTGRRMDCPAGCSSSPVSATRNPCSGWPDNWNRLSHGSTGDRKFPCNGHFV